MRYIVTIRDRREGRAPVAYYLTAEGHRCHLAANVAVFRRLAEATAARDAAAGMMTEFALAVEVLPPGIRNVGRAILASTPLGAAA